MPAPALASKSGIRLALAGALLLGFSDLGESVQDRQKLGRLSTVTLLTIERPSARIELPNAAGAPDALIFYFLIERAADASGLFTIAATSDCELDGRKYSDITFERLGRRFDSDTVVDDVLDFKNTERRDLSHLLPPRVSEDAVVASLVIYGSELSAGSAGRVTVDVGWGQKTEKLSFPFRVPEK